MFKDVSILTWLFLFLSYCAFDIVYTINVKAIADQKAIKTANTSVLLLFLGVYGTISYIDNLINLVPIVCGCYLGSYCSVKGWGFVKKRIKDLLVSLHLIKIR
jgi:hypothetical protein